VLLLWRDEVVLRELDLRRGFRPVNFGNVCQPHSCSSMEEREGWKDKEVGEVWTGEVCVWATAVAAIAAVFIRPS